MKNDAHIDHLFKELKEARPELDVKDIQEMVVVFPDAPPPFDWGQLFNLNNIIMFALTSSLIAGTIYLFSGSAEAQSNLEQNSYYLEAEDSLTETWLSFLHWIRICRNPSRISKSILWSHSSLRHRSNNMC
jgi:hypothetical protein